VLLCGMFALAPFSSAPLGSGPVGAGAAHGGRVLAGIPDATDAAAAAPPAVYSAVMAAVLRLSFALVSSWLACGFMFAAALLLLFVRDPALDADVAMVEAASASARRAQAADALGDRAKARRWVERGLRELGHVSPRSRWETAVALAWQTVRQLLHRLWIGRAIDAFFLARTPLAAQATALAARLYQHQHQLQLKGRDSAMEALLSGVFAVNLMEAAPSALECSAAAAAAIYASLAVHAEALLRGHISILTRLYWGLARSAQRLAPRDDAARPLQYIFQPAGYHHLLRGQWTARPVRDAFGVHLPPGSLEHVAAAFRLGLLDRAVTAFIAGDDADKCAELYRELLQYAAEAGDQAHAWWALLGLTAVCWRQGKPAAAGTHLDRARALSGIQMSTIHHLVLAVFQAKRALVDGDTAAAIEAAARASDIIRVDRVQHAADPSGNVPTHMQRSARLIALQVLLETRVGLYHLRRHQEAQSPADPATSQLARPAGLLAAAQDDLAALVAFSEYCTMAEPAALLYQAVLRHLAGGGYRTTEHLLHESLKSARRLGLRYDEGMVLLQGTSCLRSSSPPARLQERLAAATAIFSRLQASDALRATRRLAQSLML
jgi:hypothetical protein